MPTGGASQKPRVLVRSPHTHRIGPTPVDKRTVLTQPALGTQKYRSCRSPPPARAHDFRSLRMALFASCERYPKPVACAVTHGSPTETHVTSTTGHCRKFAPPLRESPAKCRHQNPNACLTQDVNCKDFFRDAAPAAVYRVALSRRFYLTLDL